MANQKFQYVISAQVYGKQKKEMDSKADDIDFLLKKYPNLRVAYIDRYCAVTLSLPNSHPLTDAVAFLLFSEKVQDFNSSGIPIVKEEYYSVLVKGVDTGFGEKEIQEVYRIKLPGNPIIGEGKPENQNHAIIFTRGEAVQAIDMNQENYMEEALKIRNLLCEFKRQSTPNHPCTIVGFRENIYTGSLSSVANYMALQEGCFVSLGQRVLARPLRIRMHYGHPDVFDKLWFMSRGGISKASKGINLSEDIFAGFNAVLRGASVSFHEYIQCGKGRDVGLQQLYQFEAKLSQGAAMQSVSRDIFRLGHTLDFFRLLSFYFGGLGFYICNSLTIWALYLFLYARVLLAAFHYDDPHAFSGADTISYWFGQIGFLLTLPIFASVGLDNGFKNALMVVGRMMFTGGPLYFIFHMGTKAHYFERTLLAGGAKYRPTGRGFLTKHETFATNFRFFAFSHIYKSFELMLLLSLYGLVCPYGTNYAAITWAGWVIAASWLFSPFWFNPMAFSWEKTVADYHEFKLWMAREEGSEDNSWLTWWTEEVSYLKNLDILSKFTVCVFNLRHALVGWAILSYNGSSVTSLLTCAAFISIAVCFVYVSQQSQELSLQSLARGLQALTVVGALVGALVFVTVYEVTAEEIMRTILNFVSIAYIFIG